MEKILIRAMTGKGTHSRLWIATLFGAAALAFAGTAIAKEVSWNPGGPVDFVATIANVREVPAGDPMPGMHVDVKVKGKTVDVYVAPMEFVEKYGIKLSKGDDVRIVGKQEMSEVVLANEITTGTFDNSPRGGGAFRADTTVYLRNEDGPFWKEAPRVPGPAPVAAH